MTKKKQEVKEVMGRTIIILDKETKRIGRGMAKAKKVSFSKHVRQLIMNDAGRKQ